MKNIGELASRSLDAFVELNEQAESAPESLNLELSDSFLVNSVAMVRRLPTSSRYEFSRVLPFSAVEFQGLQSGGWQASAAHRQDVGRRLHDWVQWGSLFLNEGERIVDCQQYIHAVVPYLADDDERNTANMLLDWYGSHID